MAGEIEQQRIVAFLSRADSYVGTVSHVDHIVTHISHVFLAGGHAYKLKRAVHLPYVDFSGLEQRRIDCERELRLNRRTAPEIYENILPVTEAAGGKLSLDGQGRVVDWLVVMRRFEQDQLLDRIAKEGCLTSDILRELSDTIADFHADAEPAQHAGGAAAMEAIIDGIAASFADCAAATPFAPDIERLVGSLRASLSAVAPLLDERRAQGRVRHCHGDLHLNNICLMDGHPVLFDCVEFDDRFSIIDVLYDLAFLLMDLLHRGLIADANYVFNRYIDKSGEVSGISAISFFMSVRAAIRSHIRLSTDSDPTGIGEGQAYLRLASRILAKQPARLIAIGGLSGTGKSTLAYGLAPDLGNAPGARVIRSDVTRKRLFNVAPETPLESSGYDISATRWVYDCIAEDAAASLCAGQSVIVDAVFARPAERSAIRQVARDVGVPFTGFWLSAPVAELEQRIIARRNDASDATVSVLHQQTTFYIGPNDWIQIDASGGAKGVVALARRAMPPE